MDVEEALALGDPAVLHYGKQCTRLLRRVAQQARVEVSRQDVLREADCNYNYCKRVARYTGFGIDQLKDINSKKNIKGRLNTKEIDRSTIQTTLMTHYLVYKNMPSTTTLFNALWPALPAYANIDYFRRILVKMGYCWKRIGGKRNGSVIVEHPKIKFERYWYLSKITEHRKNHRPLCFIGVAITKKRDPDWKYGTGLHLAYAIVENKLVCSKLLKELSEDTIEEWFLQTVVPNLKEHSVVVFNDLEHVSRRICPVPTLDSNENEIIEWLDFHNVPYNRAISKWALYTLVEKYTDVHEDLYAIDVHVKSHGHDVLRTPACIRGVAPTSLVERALASLCPAEVRASVTAQLLAEHDERVAQEEARLLHQDIQLDKVWSALLDNVAKQESHGIEIDDYLPELSDSD
ncbi:unnamed protein product [Colias eurytheme]|nr:unnamed protein product [Colias eurytheme]